jgi:THO complex subunit 4
MTKRPPTEKMNPGPRPVAQTSSVLTNDFRAPHFVPFHPRVAVKAAPIPPRRIRQKKGPKRLKKKEPVTIDDLDREMEDYRAAAPDYHLGL